MLIALPCLLAACGGSIQGNELAPPSLIEPCQMPAVLPDRALSQREVEIYWGNDRSALRACASQVTGLTDWMAEKR